MDADGEVSHSGDPRARTPETVVNDERAAHDGVTPKRSTEPLPQLPGASLTGSIGSPSRMVLRQLKWDDPQQVKQLKIRANMTGEIFTDEQRRVLKEGWMVPNSARNGPMKGGMFGQLDPITLANTPRLHFDGFGSGRLTGRTQVTDVKKPPRTLDKLAELDAEQAKKRQERVAARQAKLAEKQAKREEADRDRKAREDAKRAKELERQRKLAEAAAAKREQERADRVARGEAATTVQTAWRGKMAREQMEKRRLEHAEWLKKQDESANRIQQQWKVKLAKDELERRREERRKEEEERAARAQLACLEEIHLRQFKQLQKMARNGETWEDLEEGAGTGIKGEQLAWLHEQFDKYGSGGYIDPDGFFAFYAAYSEHEIDRDEADALFSAIDLEKVGRIGFNQFTRLFELVTKVEKLRRDPKGAKRAKELVERMKALAAKYAAEAEAMRAKLAAQREAERKAKEARFALAKEEERAARERREKYLRDRKAAADRKKKEDAKIIEEARRKKEVDLFLQRAANRAERANRKALQRLKDGNDDSSESDDEDDLSEEELAALRDQFNHFDVDGSGAISREEFHAFYNSIAVAQMNVRDCDVLYDELDEDGSGELDFEEFVKVYMLLQRREAAKREGGTGASNVQKLEAKLARKKQVIAKSRAEGAAMREAHKAERSRIHAANKDKAADVKEMEASAIAVRDAHIERRRQEAREREAIEKKMIEDARDTEKMKMFLQKARNRAQRDGFDEEADDDFTPEELALLRTQFDRFDVDHSGEISRDEFTIFYNAIAVEALPPRDARILFDDLDIDGSGQLGFDEFLKVYGIIQKREAAKRDPLGHEKLVKIDSKLALMKEQARRESLKGTPPTPATPQSASVSLPGSPRGGARQRGSPQAKPLQPRAPAAKPAAKPGRR